MADEVLNWKQFNQTFKKASARPISAPAWKVLESLLSVVNTKEVNGSTVKAFKANMKASSKGLYIVQLGKDYYKAARKKITGKMEDVDKYVKGPQPWQRGKLAVHETTLQGILEIYFPPFKDTKKGGVTGKETIRIKLTGKAWAPAKSASERTSIDTEEQEAVSLEIIKEVLKYDTPRWKSFEQMYKRVPKLKKIHPNLQGTGDWWPHFETQFQYIDKLAEFPSGSYNTFSHTKGFMQFISKLVTTGSAPGEGGVFKEFAKFAEKDSWNPADVWLITKQTKPRFDNSSKQSPGIKQRLLAAISTKEINDIMRYAYQKRVIVGISLKKNLGYTKKEGVPQPGRLKFERVNLEKKVDEQDLPTLKWTGIKFDPSFDEKTNAFISKTSYLYFQYGKRNFALEFKSNQGNKQTDITYEFSEKGSKAQLGKIPKDRFTSGMKKLIGRDYPHHDDYDNFDKGKYTKKFNAIVSSGILKTPPTGWGKKDGSWWDMGSATTKDWTPKVADENGKKVHAFVNNMQKAWRTTSGRGGTFKVEYNFKSYRNLIMYQMFDFLYCVALMHNEGPRKMKRYLSDLFYFAQKKGQIWGFGPFGKLY